MITQTIRAAILTKMPQLVLALAVVNLWLLLDAPRPAHASTPFTVNQITDVPDANLSDNLCDINSFVLGEKCPLRAAIQQANDTPGADTINFNLFGTGVHTISPNTGLPNITDLVTINGYSQPGASVNTLAKGTNAKLMIQLYGAKILDESGGLYINAPDVVVRGLVINGFDHGIWVSSGAANTKIVGNFVGTEPAGTQAPGNYTGVTISDNSGVASNTVGGSTPASRNLISGNVYCGVCVSFDGNEVSGNLIGTQRDGKSPLGNSGDSVGVRSSDNIVGRAAPGYANTIAFNGGDGVMINGSNTVSNSILSNSIFSNAGLGIDLVDAGITPNDSGDADTGANNLQNYPVITSAKKASGHTTIKGKLNSTPTIPSRSSSSRTPRLQTGARRS